MCGQSQLIPQLARSSIWTTKLRFPLALFTWGLVKKLVFADPFSSVVDKFYAAGATPSIAECWLAFYGFALQIYCDFSGYCDMALGLAFALGIRLPLNFNRPYVSADLVEFWRRWHITLLRWLRDYLYIPLGGNRHGVALQLRNILITMTLGGLWHGANLTFLLWGCAHGLGIGAYHLIQRTGLTRRIPEWAGVAITFHLVALGWILFRAPDFSTAARIFKGLFTGPTISLMAFASTYAFPLVLLGIFFCSHRFDAASRVRFFASKAPSTLLDRGGNGLGAGYYLERGEFRAVHLF